MSKKLPFVQCLNDGNQAPMRRHPILITQNAFACCYHGCLSKWYYVLQ
ncbi:DUF4186 family protein [Anaerotignum faecicola]